MTTPYTDALVRNVAASKQRREVERRQQEVVDAEIARQAAAVCLTPAAYRAELEKIAAKRQTSPARRDPAAEAAKRKRAAANRDRRAAENRARAKKHR